MLQNAIVYLSAAVVSVLLFRRLGLGSVLGYLVAGMVIGPSGLGLIADVESVLHIAELGVVLLMFLIGLELQPTRLWAMRVAVFGMGALQVLATSGAVAVAGWTLGLTWPAAALTGMGLSLSSTAFALQILAEKNQLTSQHGRAAFGILLFQDLAVIPPLAVLPLLGPRAASSNVPGWLAFVQGLVALALVVVAGRYVIRPIFRAVAGTHSQELFTATALLVVVGTAVGVNQVGLSMALGAFLAGVLLAESEYRHELEADLEPFKGLLLGLFFMAVGMGVNLGLLASRPLTVVGLVLGLVGVKGLVLYGLGRIRMKVRLHALALAVVISQGGEFAFVLFDLSSRSGIMDVPLKDLLVLVVSMSMAVTPLLLLGMERLLPQVTPKQVRPYDVAVEEDAPQVIIAGFGRVGQVVARLLRAKRIPFAAMDASPEHVDFVKKFGSQIFYGDASRLDLLRAAKADKARIFVLAIDDVEASLRTAQMVLQHFPQLTVFARARNRQHAYRLLDVGVKNIMRETLGSSLELTENVLNALGLSKAQSRRAVEQFREHDERMLADAYTHHRDENKLTELAAKARRELEELFDKDAESTVAR